MSGLSCCIWWLLLGLLLGWLLNWLLSKFMGKDGSSGSGSSGSGGSGYNTHSHTSNAHASGSTNGSVSGSVSGAAGAALAGAATVGTAAAKTVMIGGADIAKAAAAGFKIKGNDDIEIIEGIGPKIGELFRENGAGSFDKIMHLSVPAMNAILEKGGSRFKLANPGTWAQQAKLCYENRWSELQMLQDNLSAGIDKSDSSNA